jgi:SAM-dependent methyltransferase
MVDRTNYTQGYSASTLSSHASRESDAAFLLPHLKPTDRILDVGCGPGSITAGFCAHAAQRSVVGIDLSEDVLEEAQRLYCQTQQLGNESGGETVAAAAVATAPALPGAPPVAKGNLTFIRADLLQGLPFADAAFDVVYASQLFPHLAGAGTAAAALAEMRRVLRPGGVLATRDAMVQHFFPREMELEHLFTRNALRALGAADWPGAHMPALYRAAGFHVDDDGGQRVRVGCGTTCHADAASRRWWADGLMGRPQEGDGFRRSWEAAGVSKGEIAECVRALERWAGTEDAWYAILQCEMLAWK